MLATAHDIAYCDRLLRSAASGWGNRSPLNLMDGGTFGIVGFGRIGRAVVEKERSFGMDVLVTDPRVPDDVFAGYEVEQVDLRDPLERSDCVSIHSPTPQRPRGCSFSIRRRVRSIYDRGVMVRHCHVTR
jgi:phosphoglycerate dehydrogenase-like enzyme